MTKLPLFGTFGQALKKTFTDLYASMGLSMLISFCWFLGYFPILFFIGAFTSIGKLPAPEQFAFFVVTIAGIGLWNTICIGPLTSGFYSFYQARKDDYPSIKMFWQGFKKNYLRSAIVHGVFSIVSLILAVNIIIGFRQSNIILIMAAVLSAYILLLAVLTSFYYHPLLYLNNNVKKVLKKSVLLTLDNMGLSIFYSLFLGIFLLFSIVLVLPLVLVYGALVNYFIEHGFEPIYQKYD